jgi:type IV pilus assembly protein PilC
MERSESLKRKVRGAMIYPIVVILVAIGILTFIMIKIVPTFEDMFNDFGLELPAATQLLMSISRGILNYWYLIPAIPIGLWLFIKLVRKFRHGRMGWDMFVLKIPVFGPLIEKNILARTTRTLGTLVASGVPILDGLLITAKASGNKVIEEAIMKTRVSISEGKTIAEPLEQSQVFSGMVVQMIGVGESTGSLDAMLNKIADFYDEEVDATVAALTSLLEPLMMVVLGVLIGGMMVAMYLPIFKMASVVA